MYKSSFFPIKLRFYLSIELKQHSFYNNDLQFHAKRQKYQTLKQNEDIIGTGQTYLRFHTNGVEKGREKNDFLVTDHRGGDEE